MAGLYIHVPFCTKRCTYCDFFSSTEIKYKKEYIQAVIRELELRKDYIGGETVSSVYFGGGTPSQLTASDFGPIFDTIYRLYAVDLYSEITLEANPDDLTSEYISSLHSLPFNRISMGIQSFRDDDLQFLNRRHTSSQAIRAVEECRQQGFHNLSVDLIYGIPQQTLSAWNYNLTTAVSLGVPHISAYHLIYEEGTALYKLKEAGKVTSVEEDLSVSMFSLLIDLLTTAGFRHYEISNFGKDYFFSRHNSGYWNGKKYLGVGPSAHSYNGENRQWNVSSMPAYLKGVADGTLQIEKEDLDLSTRYNDFIITGLRTIWGIDLNILQKRFGPELLNYCKKQIVPHLNNGLLKQNGNIITLTRSGIFISDSVMSDLLFV